MQQALMLNAATNIVANVLGLDPAVPWDPPPGFTVVFFAGEAQEGWFWNGTIAVAPVVKLTVDDCVQIMQGLVDGLARSWSYDSAASAVSYIGDPNPKYDAEGFMIRTYRSAMWTTGELLLKTLDPANPPTRSAFIALLPTAPARPSF